MAKTWKKLGVIALSIGIAEGIGFAAGMLSGDIQATYGALRQPPLAPPDWLFPVVWGILYALMGIAAALIYMEEIPKSQKHYALRGYAMQLLINFVWPIVFFRFEAFVAAAWMLTGLLILVWECYREFRTIRPVAGYLLIPYLIWLLFALCLNVGVAVLN